MDLSPSNFFPDKRKASMDNMMSQPPLKKLATDSSMGVAAANSVAGDIAGASSDGYATNIDSNMQMLRPLANNNIAGPSSRREIVGSQRLKASAALEQACKNTVDPAELLPSLYECFGESILTFVPSSQASVFL